ncbi:MAG: hypothetical protein KJ736_04575 [Candidatus Omnitrophica bacterium]|nr:hypothetical protein [Candidatus Omnitrophota bacterium]
MFQTKKNIRFNNFLEMFAKAIFFFVLVLFETCVFSQQANASGAMSQGRQTQQVAQQQAAQEIAQQQAQGQASTTEQQQVKRKALRTRTLKKEVDDLKAHEIVDIYQVWEQLEVSSEIWALIMDHTPKDVTVARYIRLYAEGGIYIRKSSSHYVKLIDSMAKESPNLLKSPFREVLRFIAIMEYDFDNGQDRGKLALQTLGRKLYEDNRIRLGVE